MGKIQNYIDALKSVRLLIGTDSVCANDIETYSNCLFSKIMEYNTPEDAASYVIKNLTADLKAENDRLSCGYKVEHSSMMVERYLLLLRHLGCKLSKMEIPIDEQTKTYLLSLGKEPQQMPEELETAEAKSYFKKAIELGLMDNNYQWLKGEQMLACFAREMSIKLKLGKGDRISWKPFETLFNRPYGKLRGNLNDLQKTGDSPIDVWLIDKVFE